MRGTHLLAAPVMVSAVILSAVIDLGRPRADSNLALTATAEPDPIAAGTTLSYQLSVSNTGPDAATDTVLTLDLPDSLWLTRIGTLIFADGFESGDLTAWTPVATGPAGCSQVGAVVQCALGSVANGATTSRTLEVTVPETAQGTLPTTVSVSSAVTDSNPANNTVALATAVVRRADLALGVGAGPDPVSPGGVLTTAWTVANFGPSTATGAQFDQPLPPELTLISALPDRGSCGGGSQLHCELGTLPSGTEATVVVRALVAASASGSITQSASAEAFESDLELSNNLATAVTTISGSRRPRRAPNRER